LAGDFEGTQVRREEQHALALRAGGERRLGALGAADHRHHLLVRAEPDRGPFHDHLPGGSDRLAPRARVAVARLLEVGAQVPAVSG
jgi:hypothetical protein